MKTINVPNFVYPTLGLIGLLNYVPIFFCPSALNILYFEYKNIIITFCFVLLFLITLVSNKRKLGLVSLFGYVLVLFFSSQIRKVENELVINCNLGKNVSEFKSPILGYILELPQENKNDIPFDAIFKFNQAFGSYQALVYKKNHGLKIDSFEGDFSLSKIYNKDWWLYIKAD
jgi:hypothetical protein